MDRRPVARLVILLAAMGSMVGCGSDGYVLAPVSGKVTVDGEPAADLRISFEPVATAERKIPGPESIGITDDEGKFTLTTLVDSRRGAVVGKCRVRIWSVPGSQQKQEEIISNDRDPNYDPVKEVNMLKEQLELRRAKRGAKKAARPTAALPLRYNDNTELSFDVPPGGTDRADFQVSRK